MIVSIPERLGIETEAYRRLLDGLEADTHCCKPGIVESFDGNGTVTVRLAIKEKILSESNTVQDIEFPILVDVPIVMPRAGGFALTLPVRVGDECLVIFSDIGIDWWWQNGGVQNKTQDLRRHDLSDGFAILAPWSKPRNLSNYSTNSAQLRNESGTAYIEITSSGQINMVSSNGTINIDGKPFATHHHTGVQTGTGQTGDVA